MKLKTITFDYFKSFGNNVVISDLQRINSIMGGNGTGKSNIIDGIAFALNAPYQRLRASPPQSLIHGSIFETPLSNQCSVQMEFVNNNLQSMTIKRTMYYDKKKKKPIWCLYKVNEEEVSEDTYKDFLKNELMIVPGLKNVIVAQGDVDNFENLDPMEFTKFIEDLGGNFENRQIYERDTKELNKIIKEEIVLKKERNYGLKDRQLLVLFEEKEKKESELNERYNEALLKAKSLDVFKNLKKLSEDEESLDICLQSSSDRRTKLEEALSRKETLFSERDKFNNELNEIKNQIRDGNTEIMDFRNQIKSHLNGIEIGRQQLLELEEKKRLLVKEDNAINENDSKMMQKITAIRNKIDDLKSNFEKVPSYGEELHKEYDQLNYTFTMENKIIVQSLEIKESLFQFLLSRKDKLIYANDEHKTEEAEVKKLKDKLDLDSKNVEKDIQKESEKLDNGEKRLQTLKHQIKQLDFEIDRDKESSKRLKREVNIKDCISKAISDDRKTNIIVKMLKNEFGNKVYGRFIDLMVCQNSNFNDLFYGYMFSKRNSILVKDKKTLFKCLTFIKKIHNTSPGILSYDDIKVPQDVLEIAGLFDSNAFVPLINMVKPSISGIDKFIEYLCTNVLFSERETQEASDFLRDNRFVKCKVVLSNNVVLSKGKQSFNEIRKELVSDIRGYNIEDHIKLNNDTQDIFKKIMDKSLKKIELSKDTKGIIIDINEIKDKLNKLSVARIKLGAFVENCCEKLNFLASIINGNKEEISEVEKEMEILSVDIETLKESKSNLMNNVFRGFMEKHHLESLDPDTFITSKSDLLHKIEPMEENIERLTKQRDLDISKKEEIKRKLADTSERIRYIENISKQKNDEIKKLEKSLMSHEKLIDKLRTKEIKINDNIKNLKKSIMDLNTEIERLTTDSHDLKRGLEQSIKNTKNKLSTLKSKYPNIPVPSDFKIKSFDKTYLISVYGKDFENNLDEFHNEATAIEKDLANQLDKLNYTSVEKQHCELIRERFARLENSLKENKKKKTDLEKSLKKIKAGRSELFKNTVEMLNKWSNEILKSLFNWNEEILNIIPDSNFSEPYLKETRIVCSLPGKALRYLEHLSSGEKKLITLTLILASREMSPVSFIALDEIDANFDNEKLGYLIGLMKQLKNKVQFLIVSHVDAVHSHSDKLYGTLDEYVNNVHSTEILAVELMDYESDEEA